MSRKVELPENQIRAIMRAAKKEGVAVEMKIAGATVVVTPPAPATPLAKPKEFRR